MYPKTLALAPRQYEEQVIPFTAGDGLRCNLIRIHSRRAPQRGPVLLVHGAGVRANVFRAPVETTLVDTLIEAGYDVWLENWRASIDLAPNTWTLDEAAVFDHPEAVRMVVRQTGRDDLKAIIHCQGSTSFMMSAMAGLLPEVRTIVTNAVSLHTVVPPLAKLKLQYMLPLARPFMDYLNPQWGLFAPSLQARLISLLVAATHHECENAVCKVASFTYGVGSPTLWRHENLSPETHEWLKHEFAQVPLSFFDQITRCVLAGHLVSVDGFPALPADFIQEPPKTTARFAFFAGEQNACFLAESQIRSFAYFDRLRPGYHTLRLLPGYGHLDVFMGTHAARDTFPLILNELER